MKVRPSILTALLGTLAMAGAYALPVAPDDGERIRHERLAVFGESAAGR